MAAEFRPANTNVRLAKGIDAKQSPGGIAPGSGDFGKGFASQEEIGVHARGEQKAAHVGFNHGGLHGKEIVWTGLTTPFLFWGQGWQELLYGGIF